MQGDQLGNKGDRTHAFPLPPALLDPTLHLGRIRPQFQMLHGRIGVEITRPHPQGDRLPMGRPVVTEAIDREIPRQRNTPTIKGDQLGNPAALLLPQVGSGDRPHHPRTKSDQGHGARNGAIP